MNLLKLRSYQSSFSNEVMPMTEEELRTLNNFLKMKYQNGRDDSIREVLRCCDLVFPEVDWYIRDHKPQHDHYQATRELEFYIKVPDYFYNMSCLIDENFDGLYKNRLYDLMYEGAYYCLECFMEDNAPQRKYWTAGRSGGYLVVEHEFELPHIQDSSGSWDDWNDWARREKLEHIQYYGIGIFTCISALDELLFWYDFERNLEKTLKWIQSEEYANELYEEVLKDTYKAWLQADHDKLEKLLSQAL
jgi:hypothetical protein